MKLFTSYLQKQRKLMAMLALFIGIFAAVFSLYDLPMEAVAYAAVLSALVGVILFAHSYFKYVHRHRELNRLLQNMQEASFSLPPPASALEKDYQELVAAIAADRAEITAKADSAQQELLDYYTLWAHQIKTPIAAMHLLLQQSNGTENEALAAELVKIEEYIEMVLSYLRLGSDTTDYVLRRCALDDVVRGCLRKFARLFILKRLTLRFDETHRSVVTDEKWLSFVIGQILSNAIKYTPSGGTIWIYADGQTLAISDTGIGIRDEDLPRVFEKGFTGYNGREDQKSTGIGLYLCRQITNRLNLGLNISSRVGQGTLVRLLLSDSPQIQE